MTEQDIIDVLYAAFMTAMKLAVPLLLVSLIVGLIISIFQAATQINESTLTFVPKLLVIGVLLILLASWMMGVMKDFTVSLFDVLLDYI